jgi:16S rRNA A1518/A1519 N6-dimethyltransferase RsmA/KsgA/DIM1 with predicted DNA glycosylase/AP lyase activity
VECVGVGADDLVLDFGAGYGRLTEQLAQRASRVIAVEIDARLASSSVGAARSGSQAY